MNSRTILIALSLLAADAKADWTEFSVACLCDSSAGAFSISPFVHTSGDFNIPLPAGYRKLEQGTDRALECVFKNHRVSVTYTSLGPQASGMCRGIGFSEIRSLTVDGTQLIGGEQINSGCFFEETLLSVKLYEVDDGLVFERCTAKGWDGNAGYRDFHCTKEPLR